MMVATSVHVIDDVLSNPGAYRTHALRGQYRSYDFGHCVFHGISVNSACGDLMDRIHEVCPDFTPNLSFIRKSPLHQPEPHFIHTDVDMGDWSALFYLNPNPPPGDGTSFWKHLETGEIENDTPHFRSIEGNDPSKWAVWHYVKAKFNRLVIFPSSFYHSRATFDNWGSGNDARLVQVVFGKGSK